MSRKTTLKLAAALLASSIIATPMAAAYAGGFGPNHGAQCDHGGFKHGHKGFHKGGMFEKQARTTSLSVDEARTLVDAMILRTKATDIVIGDIQKTSNDKKIEVALNNASGELIKTIEFDAASGRMDRKDRKSLHKMMPRPNREARFDQSYSADEMNTLVQAMVIRFGQGNLKVGDLTETDRGTFMATVTNTNGDIVREMELSRVTARPIS
ncbi:hypothetical protein LPB41_28575 [Thalassospira sp. MA62]|nr:hypothetical protein [Thalassospira sp. MA62]